MKNKAKEEINKLKIGFQIVLVFTTKKIEVLAIKVTVPFNINNMDERFEVLCVEKGL